VIETFCPRAEQYAGGCQHGLFAAQAERSGR